MNGEKEFEEMVAWLDAVLGPSREPVVESPDGEVGGKEGLVPLEERLRAARRSAARAKDGVEEGSGPLAARMAGGEFSGIAEGICRMVPRARAASGVYYLNPKHAFDWKLGTCKYDDLGSEAYNVMDNAAELARVWNGKRKQPGHTLAINAITLAVLEDSTLRPLAVQAAHDWVQARREELEANGGALL